MKEYTQREFSLHAYLLGVLLTSSNFLVFIFSILIVIIHNWKFQ